MCETMVKIHATCKICSHHFINSLCQISKSINILFHLVNSNVEILVGRIGGHVDL